MPMKNKLQRWAALLFIPFAACNNISNTNTKVEKKDTVSQQNILTKVEDFWENYDFTDTAKIKDPDYGEQAFVDFINLFPNSSEESITKGIDRWIEKSVTAGKEVFKSFDSIADKYLYNVNSPYYNEKYYALILKQYIQSPVVDKLRKEKYKILLDLINKNNVGTPATDFTFKTQENKNYSLYRIKSDYIILFFYQPGCPVCEQHISLLRENTLFQDLLKKNVTMLAIYPDGDEKKWENYKENIPVSWINGMDSNKDLLNKRLYDLKASPTIYLLDKDKKVIFKDGNISDILTYLQRR